MAIPFNTTTISVQRQPDLAEDVDGYEPNPPALNLVAENIRAVIALPSGSVNLIAGDKQVFNARLTCDPCDLQSLDIVTDQTTQDQWTVLWARQFGMFGLAHTVAQLRIVVGASA